MKIVIDLEKETVNDLKLAISKIQEEINRRNNITTNLNVANKPAQQDTKINLIEVLLKNKESMLNNPLKKD